MYNSNGSVSNGSGSGSVVVNRRRLLEALEKCAKLSSAWPIYAQFARVRTKDKQLVVEATDLGISIRVNIADNDNIANNVEFTLHSRETIKYLKSLKSNTVTISYTSNEHKTDVTITNDNGNIETFLNNMNANKIPGIPERQSHAITLSRQEFVDLFEHVYAAHKEGKGKPELEGCLITFANGKITTVATDGYRLALNSIYKDTNTNLTLLPYARAINIALNLLKKSKSSYVSFWLCDDNHSIAIKFDNVEIVSELIEYPYPDWQSVIPQKEHLLYTISTDKEQFIQALKAARESFDDKHNAFVTLETKDNILMLKTEKITTQIPAASNASEPVTFRIEYLLDALEYIKSDYVTIKLQHDTRQAAVIEHDNFKYVVMPASN